MAESEAVSVPEFEALQHLMGDVLSAERIHAARLVMVEGLSQSEAATRFNVTRQAVWKTVQRMQEALNLYKQARLIEEHAVERTLPRGWRRATICAPAAIVERSQADAEAAHQARMQQVSAARAAIFATESRRREKAV